MTTTYRTFTALLISFTLCSLTYAQQKSASCGEISSVDEFGPNVAAKARSFVLQLKTNVSQNNKAAVAAVIKYPIKVQIDGHSAVVRNRSSFLQNYDKIFTAELQLTLKKQSLDCLAYASSGYTLQNGSSTSFVIGKGGEIWYDSDTDSGPLRIVAINN